MYIFLPSSKHVDGMQTKYNNKWGEWGGNIVELHTKPVYHTSYLKIPDPSLPLCSLWFALVCSIHLSETAETKFIWKLA